MKEEKSFLKLLRINPGETPVIAVVGGGGKTSLIYRLCRELNAMGKKVVISTTTHMAYEPERPFAEGGDSERVKKLLARHGYAVAALRDENPHKIKTLSPEKLESLKKLCDVLLIEADGSRQLPLKVPEKWEPAMPSFADLVISVVGLDCLGKPIREVSHRMERTAEFLKKSMDAPVTPEDVVKIASSICGLFKDVQDCSYRVYLNKTDLLPRLEKAEEIRRGLMEKNTFAAYGSLKAIEEEKHEKA